MLSGVIKKIIILFIASCSLFLSCKTTRGTADPSREAFEYREIHEEIQSQQTHIAIAGERIEVGAKNIVEGLADLENVIADVPDNAETILPKVQSLKAEAESLQMQVEALNIQLFQERKITGEQNTKFNEYERKQNELIAEMNGEITALKINNKEVKGQRNTLLAIIITAASVILLFIVIKILRKIKIIPV